jgi:hypothetical protein|tara:strand:- start:542 stop:847 length:306 start_codon:yes stop_codon:yes gene_type:complete
MIKRVHVMSSLNHINHQSFNHMITTKSSRFTFRSSKIGNKLISVIHDAETKQSRGGFIYTLQNFNAVITDMFNQGLITLDTMFAAASAAKGEDDGTRHKCS